MRIAIRAALVALALLAAAAPFARAQVSPGPLAAPHAAIDGSLKCFECHGKSGGKGDSKDGMDARCLACHTEIGWMRTAKRGTHAKDMAKNCASCHPDHGGRDFALVVWPEGSPQKFDHRRAGYELQDAHAKLACEKCHEPKLQKSAAAKLIRKKNRAASWLGLETNCASCHEDVHRGQLGKKCESCHDQKKFDPAPGFDHAKSAFPLTGAHVKVDCLKCHAAPQFVKARDAKGKPLPEWKPLAHKDCVSCHKDPHRGQFPGACAKCHVTDDWKRINKAGFDHDRTKYPLRGKHALVACEKCHEPRQGGFGPKPKFAACTDCHKDAHAGTATLAGVVVDCAKCHEVKGWTPSTYTAIAHAKSTYPLEGRHFAAACEKCHVRAKAGTPAAVALGPARVQLRPKKGACTDCHFDPHRGRFEPAGARPQKDGCRACHTLGRFAPSTYDAAAHANCVFPLRGGHLATPCQQCHAELLVAPARSSLLADSSAARPLRFDNPQRACVECHRAQNPHGEQFAQRRDKGACDACHVDFAFVPASKFDHNRDSSYRLEGAHARTPCASCHVPAMTTDGKKFVTYRPTPTKCEACHTSGPIGPLMPEQGR